MNRLFYGLDMENQVDTLDIPLSGSFLPVAIAVNDSMSSKRVVQWALDKFIPEGIVHFRLLYVRPKITSVPTPMGNYIPISNVRDDVASAYKREIEWQTDTMLLSYKHFFYDRKVEVDSIIIEADDVADALSGEIAKLKINKLVIGASSQNIFMRKFKEKTYSKISACCPSFCTVYVVSKGKLVSIRAAKSVIQEKGSDESSSKLALSFPSNSSTGKFDIDVSLLVHGGPSLPKHYHYFENSNNNFDNISSVDIIFHRRESLMVDQAADNSSSAEQIDINSELQNLRIELMNDNIVEVVQNESIGDFEVVGTCMKEVAEIKSVEPAEEVTAELTVHRTKGCEAAEKDFEHMMKSVRNEFLLNGDAGDGVTQACCENRRFERALGSDIGSFKKYTWEEIKSATSSFSEILKIGKGANGTVYKGRFDHTVAAVKVLHSNEGHTQNQFKRELDILGNIHHPHLLLLIGACLENGCLIYEYMENGSLEDRLQCKDNTPPLPWFHRFNIAWEIASALSFLHNTKPEPIIHRDLKPANILLDRNFISKIGDVGLSTLVPYVNSLMSTICKDTAPVGTICYIDPEYQRTGQVSPKSDIYALGIVILQLLTGKPPIGLAFIMESAMEDGSLCDFLDSRAGEWPENEALELAHLGLSCSEIRRKDRPDLDDQVLPVLERLRKRAYEDKSLANYF